MADRTPIAAGGLVAVALAGIAATQPVLARTLHEVKQSDDSFALPPPAELHVATLGWDAAVVDLLWADLLVENGTHLLEKREFLNTPKYVDAILELEPDYPPVYKYVATLLVFRPIQGTEDDARKARAYLERGTRERPTDSSVWLDYGEFVAYIGPSYLQDEAEKNAWRIDGARAMARAVELGADPDRALSAASILSRGGDRRGVIAFLRRAYAQTAGPGMEAAHESIGERLAMLQASAVRDELDARRRAIEERRRKDAWAIDPELYMILGPAPDVFACAGIDGYGGPGCTRPECCRNWDDALSVPGSSADSP